MKRMRSICALATFALAASSVNAVGVRRQQSAPPSGSSAQAGANASAQSRVLGEVTAIDHAANRMTVKTDAGAVVAVTLSEATKYMRIPAGETSPSKAAPITLAEVKVGDRVYVPGRLAEGGQSIAARSVYMMARAEITEKNERERAEWRRRGVAGTITALNPATKEITITARTREGMRPVVVAATGDNVRFRRYAPDSVRFSDARPSTFAELQIGDQLRALGERSADGARFTPEEIVSGAFRTIGGRVAGVDAAANEIKLVDVQTQQPLTVTVNKDSTVRRLPPMMAQMLAARAQGGGAPGAAAGGNNANQGTPGGAPHQRQQRPEGAGGSAEGGAARMGGGNAGGGGRDLGEMLESLPALNLAELKAGDMIVVSSTKSADASRVTAIAVLAGVEALFTSPAAQGRPGVAPRTANTNLGLPSDALGIGIGP